MSFTINVYVIYYKRLYKTGFGNGAIFSENLARFKQKLEQVSLKFMLK